MSDSITFLAGTTVVTAVFHTLIPDHWLPFVLVARAERWSGRRTALLTAASALLHVSVSIALGLVAILTQRGLEGATRIGDVIGRGSAVLLILFGVGYGLWFLRKGGHQHSFGMHPHHEPAQHDPPATPHPHDLAPAGPVSGAVHRRQGRLGGATLALIVGFNPCLLVIPYFTMAGTVGAPAVVAVAAAFAVSTIACMVAVATAGLKGTARLESPFLMRYGEAVSGALIAVTGVVVLLAGD